MSPASGVTNAQIDAVFAKFSGSNDFGVPYLRTYAEGFRTIARALLAEQQAPSTIPGMDPAYMERLIDALQENGDPISVDAADEFQRLLDAHASNGLAPSNQLLEEFEPLIARWVPVTERLPEVGREVVVLGMNPEDPNKIDTNWRMDESADPWRWQDWGRITWWLDGLTLPATQEPSTALSDSVGSTGGSNG